MTKFKIFRFAVREEQEEKIIKFCEKEDIIYQQKEEYIITNLLTFFDEKQMKF